MELSSYIEKFNCSEPYQNACRVFLLGYDRIYNPEKPFEEYVYISKDEYGDNNYDGNYSELADALNALANNLHVYIENLVANRDTIKLFVNGESIDYDALDNNEPIKPSVPHYPDEPKEDDEKYNIKPISVPFLQRLFNDSAEENARIQAQKDAYDLYKRDHDSWELAIERIDSEYEDELKKYEKKYESWMANRSAFHAAKDGDSHSVEMIVKNIIDTICLPFEFTFNSDVEYQRDNKRLIIDVNLPTIVAASAA